MLRNSANSLAESFPYSLLNEVLSLNAQEFGFADVLLCIPTILNEVLSLNAQELGVIVHA